MYHADKHHTIISAISRVCEHPLGRVALLLVVLLCYVVSLLKNAWKLSIKQSKSHFAEVSIAFHFASSSHNVCCNKKIFVYLRRNEKEWSAQRWFQSAYDASWFFLRFSTFSAWLWWFSVVSTKIASRTGLLLPPLSVRTIMYAVNQLYHCSDCKGKQEENWRFAPWYFLVLLRVGFGSCRLERDGDVVSHALLIISIYRFTLQNWIIYFGRALSLYKTLLCCSSSFLG